METKYFVRARAIGQHTLLDGLLGGLIEVIAWCDTGEAEAAADIAAWLRRRAEGESNLYLAWADYAEATAAALRNRPTEARSLATRAMSTALPTGDKRLVGRLEPLLA